MTMIDYVFLQLIGRIFDDRSPIYSFWGPIKLNPYRISAHDNRELVAYPLTSRRDNTMQYFIPDLPIYCEGAVGPHRSLC